MSAPLGDSVPAGIESLPTAPSPAKKDKIGSLPLEGEEHVIKELREAPPTPQGREADSTQRLSEETLTHGAHPIEARDIEHHVVSEGARTLVEQLVEKARSSALPRLPQQEELPPAMPAPSPVPFPSPAQIREKQREVENGLVSRMTGGLPIPGMPTGPFNLEQRMHDTNVRGVRIALINNGRVEWEKGYGELRTEPEETSPLSQAASMSKTVTALTIMSLIEQCRRNSQEGKPSGLIGGISIDLNTDISGILPESLWNQIDPQHLSREPGHEVTIRKLLSHTAGLGKGAAPYGNREGIEKQKQQIQQEIETITGKISSLELDPEHSPTTERSSLLLQLKAVERKLEVLEKELHEAIQEHFPTTDDLVEGRSKLGRVEVIAQPGSHYEYSNKGIVLIQKLVEVLTQKHFDEVVQEQLFNKNKLDLERSTYSPPRLEDTIHGNDEEGHPIPGMWVRIPELAAGGLWTTPGEMAKVPIEIQKALRGKSTLISASLAQEMLQSQIELPNRDSPGLGVFVEGGKQISSERKTALYFNHDGHAPGFHNYMIANDNGQGVVIMTNSSIGEDLCSELVKSIASAYHWPNANDLGTGGGDVVQCRPYLAPEEIAPPTPETIKAWAAKVQGRYNCWEKEESERTKPPEHTIEIRFDQETRKVYADVDGGGSQEGGRTIELVPGGDTIATYLKTAPGFYALCDFSPNKPPGAPITGHNLFGWHSVRTS